MGALVALLALPGTSTPQAGHSIDYTLSGTPGEAGWWRSDVTIHWDPQPEPDGGDCLHAESVPGDTAGTTRGCTAIWNGWGSLTATTATIRIDKTPPTSLHARAGRRPDSYGWYGRDVRILFSGADGLSGIATCSTPVYRGPNSANALARGSCWDRAGNRQDLVVTFKYHEPIVSPRAGRKVARAPLIDWIAMPNARRFNVQVWRKGSKVLSRFPKASRFQMPKTWIQGGVRYRMQSGRYDVYVWPRFRRYGKLVGHTYFIRR